MPLSSYSVRELALHVLPFLSEITFSPNIFIPGIFACLLPPNSCHIVYSRIHGGGGRHIGIKVSQLLSSNTRIHPSSPYSKTLPFHLQFCASSDLSKARSVSWQTRKEPEQAFAFQELPAWWGNSPGSGHSQSTWAELGLPGR